MHGNKPGIISVGHAGIQDGYRRVVVVPAQAHVALVGGDDSARRAGPGHDAAQLLYPSDAARGIGRGINEYQGGILEVFVDAQRGGPSEEGANLVGGIGHRGEGDGLAAHAQQGRQPGDGLLRAHHGQDAVYVHVVAAAEGGGDGFAQLGSALRLRITGGLGGRGQRQLHAGGDRIYGVAHRKVNDSIWVRLGLLLGASQRVPGEIRKRLS